MERQEMIQNLNEATVLIGELNIPAKYTETISIPVYAALQRKYRLADRLLEGSGGARPSPFFRYDA